MKKINVGNGRCAYDVHIKQHSNGNRGCGSQSRFYDDVYPDHHKTPDFAMLDTVTNETVADRDLQGLVQQSDITTDPTA